MNRLTTLVSFAFIFYHLSALPPGFAQGNDKTSNPKKVKKAKPETSKKLRKNIIIRNESIEETPNRSLTIYLELGTNKPASMKTSLESKSQNLATCNIFKTSWNNYNSQWGFETFQTTDCTFTTQPENPSKGWVLKIKAEQEKIVGTLSYVAQKQHVISEAKVTVKKNLRQILEDEEFVSLFIAAIRDGMPFIHQIESEDLKKNKKVTYIKKTQENITLPEKLILFEKKFDEKNRIFRPDVIGEMTLHRKRVMTKDGKKLRWKIKLTKEPKKGEVFAQLPEGSLTLQKDWIELAEKRARGFKIEEFITDLGRNVLSQGYLGLRFGLPVFHDTFLAEKSSFFGYVNEFRRGFLDGIRIIWDLWPEVSETVGDDEVSFGGNRFFFGYKLYLEIPYLFTAIDITPVVGVFNFQLDLVQKQDNGDQRIIRFRTEESLSIGVEVGVEREIIGSLVRLWGMNSLGIDSVSQEQVKIWRVGGDWVVDLFPIRPFGKKFNFSLLVFGFLEEARIPPTKEDSEDDFRILALDYRQAYIGGGTTITW